MYLLDLPEDILFIIYYKIYYYNYIKYSNNNLVYQYYIYKLNNICKYFYKYKKYKKILIKHKQYSN